MFFEQGFMALRKLLFVVLCMILNAVANADLTILNPGFEYPDVSGYEYEPNGTDWSHSSHGFVLADSDSA